MGDVSIITVMIPVISLLVVYAYAYKRGQKQAHNEIMELLTLDERIDIYDRLLKRINEKIERIKK